MEAVLWADIDHGQGVGKQSLLGPPWGLEQLRGPPPASLYRACVALNWQPKMCSQAGEGHH